MEVKEKKKRKITINKNSKEVKRDSGAFAFFTIEKKET